MNYPPFCVRCSRHLHQHNPQSLCHKCKISKPDFDFVWAACLYNQTLKKLIHQFKYQHKTYLRNVFADTMLSFLKAYQLDIQQFHIIVPIPLSGERFRERGFNQTQLLAERIAQSYHIPLSVHNFVKRRATQSQSLLDQKNRWTNVRGAFTIKNSQMFDQKNILIIDDLLTTGATSSEAARTLKKIGAGRVGVFTLAITP